jgi:hypothetical protein
VRLARLGILSAIMLVAGSVMLAGSAHADGCGNDTNWGYNNGNGPSNGPATLVVRTVVYEDGSYTADVPASFKFYDQTGSIPTNPNNPNYTPDPNYISTMSQWKARNDHTTSSNNGESSGTFSSSAAGGGVNCAGYAVFGEGTSSSQGNGYVLECHNPFVPTGSSFEFTEGMIDYADMSAPSNYASGGSWALYYENSNDSPGLSPSLQSQIIPGQGFINLHNGSTQNVILVYTVPDTVKQPFSPLLSLLPQTGYASGGPRSDRTVVYPGEPLKFDVDYSNTGGDPTSSVTTFLDVDIDPSGAGSPAWTPSDDQGGDWPTDYTNRDMGTGCYRSGQYSSTGDEYHSCTDASGNLTGDYWKWGRTSSGGQQISIDPTRFTDPGSNTTYGAELDIASNAPNGTDFCLNAYLEYQGNIQGTLYGNGVTCYVIQNPPAPSYNILQLACPGYNATGCATQATVAPGGAMHYWAGASNSGGAGTNVAMEDLIPWNIDPSTISGASVTFQDGGITYSIQCPMSAYNPGDLPSDTPFGNVGCTYYPGESQSLDEAYYTNDSGNLYDPPTFLVYADYMPGGATYQLNWNGNVKSASQVSTYPVPYIGSYQIGDDTLPSNGGWGNLETYCAGSNLTTSSDCSTAGSSPNTGWQGAATYARIGGNWPILNRAFAPSDWWYYGTGFDGWHNSNTVYNPIPAAVPTVTKTYTPGSSIIPSGDFSTQSGLNTGTFNLSVNSAAGYGPISYYMVDQVSGGGGAQLGTDIHYDGSTCSSYCVSFGTPDKGPMIVESANGVPFTNLASNYESAYFGVNFANDGVPLGGTTSNTGGITWTDYSGAGGALCPNATPIANSPHYQCWVSSNAVPLTRVNANSSYFNTTGGNVHAGDTVSSSDGSCPTSNSSNISTGTSASGTDLVTATGNAGIPSTSGSGLSVSNDSEIGCRPDLAAAATKYATHDTTRMSGGGTVSLTHSTFTGENDTVVDVPGGTHLGSVGSNVCINNQTTLHVHGDLYIDGNVLSANTSPCPGATGSPSFGVIVDGNIYIDAGVTSLFGYYYTSGTGGNGNVFTCSVGGIPQTIGSSSGLSASAALACNNQLTVNGLLMARQIYFDRTFGASSSSPSENFNFTGQIYAVPPPAFSSLLTNFGPPNALNLISPKY